MKPVKYVVYRYLTKAEFFNINKPTGTEKKGGGQTYIDFPTADVSIAQWKDIFVDVHGVTVSARAKGPSWECPIFSLGISGPGYPQNVTIYQRRKTSISIGAQKITSSKGNRIQAWHPACGFPEPKNPTNRTQLPAGLVVYLVKTEDNEIWAGWFINGPGLPSPASTPEAFKLLIPLLKPGHKERDAGIIKFDGGELAIDPSNLVTPFTTVAAASKPVANSVATKPKPASKPAANSVAAKSKGPQRKPRTEAEVLSSLFDEDAAANEPSAAVVQKTVKVRKRNQKAIKDLKELYGHTCQITGNKFTFKKIDGTNYIEGHHLIPLGAGGADDPRNIVILSPLIHRMLHYADVSLINLSAIKMHEDGTSYLDITINGESYRIRWHQVHAKKVLDAQED
jgi:5-methylcytosine-specific restriction protein A